MRRYEFVEGTSQKFWEIELEGESFTTRWGRIGTEGQEKSQDFDSAAEARKAHDKLVAEKEKKGYRLVGGDEADARPLTAKVPSNPAFEAAIVANPEDVQQWRVYADWLIEQGEKWGDVIAASVQGKPDAAAQSAAQASVFGDAEASVTWKHGVMAEIDFQPEEQDEEAPMEATLEKVLKHPAGHYVQRLTLGLPPNEDTAWHMEGLIEAIANAGPLPLLTVLDMSPDADHMDQPSWRRVGDARKLWKALPQLKEVLFQGAQGSDSDDEDAKPAKLGTIEAPNLEKFVWESGGLDKEVPEAVGKATLPRLRHLELWFGDEQYGNNCEIASLSKILAGKGLPALKRLGLMNSQWEAPLIEAVANSKILKQLEVLDLSMGVMSAESTQALIANKARFAHLKELNLSDNFFSIEDVSKMEGELKNAVFGEQKDDEDPEYRYPTVAE